MKGFGEKVLSALVEEGCITEFRHFYSWGYLWSESSKVGAGVVHNLSAEAERCRDIPLAAFLTALGVDGLGSQTAMVLAEKFQTLEGAQDASVGDISSLPGIGEETAVKITKGLEELRGELRNLREFVEVLPHTKRKKLGWKGKRSPLHGQVVCITGSGSLPRARLVDLIEASSATLSPTMTKRTTMLLELESGAGSSKSKSALKLMSEGLDIRIINERDFLALARG
jgi:NAD-dependent DNA ligase